MLIFYCIGLDKTLRGAAPLFDVTPLVASTYGTRKLGLFIKKGWIGVDKSADTIYNGGKKREKMKITKAFVFDFDETLAHTNAVVLDGTDDKFAEFKNPESILNGTPLELMDLAKAVHDEGHSVFILTARSNCIENAISEFLLRIEIEAKAIHCVGINANVDVAKAKRTVLLSIIENHQIVYFFDDDEKNIELAKELDCRARKV